VSTVRWLVGVLVGHVPASMCCSKCSAKRDWLTRRQYGVYAASGKVPHCRDGALEAVSGGQAVTR
jgi:hypothetical protein